MITWPDAVQRINAGNPRDLSLAKRSFGRFRRVPIVIAGNSGAGKTRIWSHLTDRARPNRMSLTVDDGYMVHPNRGSLALTTVPGQRARPRFIALGELFGSETRVEGVIFVASNGYDHIWPASADLIANTLRNHHAYDIASLRERNLREELDNFQDVCNQILRKWHCAPESLHPKWLKVVVNKADLYWANLSSAESYYLPGCGSEFDKCAQSLISTIGSASLDYYVLPIATETLTYELRSSFGVISTQSVLTSDQRDASIKCLVDNLGELCDVKH